ncbi:MAG: aminotransferase class I/II-fold pyridoxal phosphate-dependent enzyme [Staphylococcus sp.]|nr:aminotransferase class I/II-fold pyridoxal phosphate-dependent enzyme [Staphylococcus sp.]
MLEGHGDDSYRYDRPIRHNFSTNICSDFDHTPLLAHLAGLETGVKCYPEPAPASVEILLGKQHGVSPDCIIVTNGATEAIYLIAHLFGSCHSTIVSPTFREYQDACAIFNHTVSFISDIDSIPQGCRLVWLCNPNNPTGIVVDKRRLLKCIRSNPSVTFVIDQAYSDYTRLPLISPDEAVDCGNVILLHSLTKRFAIPGLRIGYGIGCNDLLGRLRRLRMPWSVNHFAIEAAKYLIACSAEYVIRTDSLHNEALRIAATLRGMGLEVSETDCNFMLCRLPAGSASDLKAFLIEKYGILIRDASNFEGLGKSHFRIAVQSAAENDALTTAIKEWMSHS